ncbi:hypothetical protein [Saccharomonospora sp.]|uniref:hypothetical protein n=1 Tax=Saccharomonospora sp. TaxID=33913 RepID=UPI002628C40F|nr:hypothetical protein [Saccharomonospora sp.]
MRTSVLAAGGVALALVLTACGDDGGDSNDSALQGGNNSSSSASPFSDISQLVASAQEQTNKSQSSSFTMEMDMAGMKMQAQGEGVYSGTNPQMSMTMQMDMPAEAQAQGMGSMSVEMIMDGQDIYLKMPSEANPDPSKPWMKMSVGEDMGGQNLDQMAQQSDPTKMLEQLQQAGGEIVNSEQTTLDGQDVTHYTIELDLSKAGDMVGDPSVAAAIPEGTMIPLELYLNGENLPVRLEMNMDELMRSTGMPGAGSATTVMTYSDWGKPVNIQAPPADQVAEMDMGAEPGLTPGS